MTVLASGSRGNSAVVASSRTRILVDAGLSCRELFRRMQQAGEDPCTLDAILITHEHQDHVQGLSVAARKLGIPVYFTEATHRAWLRWMKPRKRMSYADWLLARQEEAAARRASAASTPALPARDSQGAQGESPDRPDQLVEADAASLDDNPFYRERELAECVAEEDAEAELSCAASLVTEASEAEDAASRRPATDPSALPAVEYFRAGTDFCIGDIEILPFTIPHDAADPVGFVFTAEGIRVGLATDLGYMPANVSHHLRRCDIVMLESNHDLEMLRDGPYPWSVKQRVLSRVGHLSNNAAAEFLEKGYDGQAAYVVLAHLSESNNMPELARVAAEFALRNRMSLLANKLVVASQHTPIEPLCL
jgi:phosphoribosyl 1,2-cyclic phosphodiesterase